MQISDQVAGGEIEIFFNSIRSKETRSKYKSYLKKYMELTGIDKTKLCSEKDPIIIQRQIIDFINKRKNEGMNWGAIHNYVACMLAFYKINDIVLNTYKINKFMPAQTKVKKDRGYTHEEISKMLQFCDERTRVIVLLLASTGIRIGAIPELKLRNLEKLENREGELISPSKSDIYKVTVYENEKEEYYTFMTPECKDAFDNYIDMRKRYGEKINDDSPLIREQFDIRHKFAVSKCRSIVRETIQTKLKDITKRSNTKSKQVPVAHGFRKFFTTQLIKSGVNSIHGLMMEGHSTGIRDHYARPSEQEMFDEYSKAIKNLTINAENRLKNEIQLLKGESNEIQDLKKQVNENNAKLSDVLELIKLRIEDKKEIWKPEEYEKHSNKVKTIDERLSQKGIRARNLLGSI